MPTIADRAAASCGVACCRDSGLRAHIALVGFRRIVWVARTFAVAQITASAFEGGL